ncbi:endonuclease NucS domain-containing protein [Methanobacterium alcaliphilum]|uniref:endonuclease NucS domain-containing protein n=1 Tax=Methanobacterium alcaliphilum TaxID=392018 RepID=UPI00200B8117|nr:endonuclease NucS domain-containing protein [Methanobacterium alcaliphilum]MCK9151549.1 endonuclease NucS [Methanobacterium alcaliphilum]
MATEIGVWEIIDGKLNPIDTSMESSGDMEKDFEEWIKKYPIVLGQDLLIIGEQTMTRSGPLDFLAIDKSGNLVIIELKRGRLPRDVLAQAIDYVSDVSTWDLDEINNICLKYTGESIEDHLNENFEDVDLENININESQRILLVGFSIDEPLERMIGWLSTNYGVSINALIFKHIETNSGDKLIARTMIIPEEVDEERRNKSSRKIKMSDVPGDYELDDLKSLLKNYFLDKRPTPLRIKNILIPLCIKNKVVTREMIKEKLIRDGEAINVGKAGLILTTMSREIGIAERDYLRQIISYERPNSWEKENYKLVDEFKQTVRELIDV